jgi:ABC-type Na+ efflux pump permease subunit
LGNLLAIAVKDLKSIVRDRTALFWLVLGPMLLVALISVVYGGLVGGQNIVPQVVSGFSLMFMLFGVSGIGDSLFEERESGTLRRLLISSVSKFELLGGKLVAGYVIAVGQLSLLFAMGYLVFKVPFGKNFDGRVASLLIMLFGSFAALSLGLFVTSLFTNRKQFSAFFTVLILVMCQVGGAWLPLFLMPSWVQELSRFTLISHTMEAFNLTHFGQGLRAVLPNLGALAVQSAVYLALSFYMLEIREVSRSQRRRKILVSVVILAALIYIGSRVNAISYPSFVEKESINKGEKGEKEQQQSKSLEGRPAQAPAGTQSGQSEGNQ